MLFRSQGDPNELLKRTVTVLQNTIELHLGAIEELQGEYIAYKRLSEETLDKLLADYFKSKKRKRLRVMRNKYTGKLRFP